MIVRNTALLLSCEREREIGGGRGVDGTDKHIWISYTDIDKLMAKDRRMDILRHTNTKQDKNE